MRVQVVRSGRAECEPICAEWISAEGMMEQGSAQRFSIVVNSLRGRKLPVLIHSHGGVVLEAMLIGTLIRARGLDVAVARTERDPCSNAPQGCKVGRWSAVLGRPSFETAQGAIVITVSTKTALAKRKLLNARSALHIGDYALSSVSRP